MQRYLKKEGEYLLRTKEVDGGLQFVVSVRNPKECIHLAISYKDGAGWTVESEPAVSIH